MSIFDWVMLLGSLTRSIVNTLRELRSPHCLIQSSDPSVIHSTSGLHMIETFAESEISDNPIVVHTVLKLMFRVCS